MLFYEKGTSDGTISIYIYIYIAMLCLLRRYDQYKWVQKGTRTFKFGVLSFNKKAGFIDEKDEETDIGDNTFKRLEYWSVGSSYLIHYMGDHTLFEPFTHRNSKLSKPFVRSAPHIKEKVGVFIS